MTPEQYNEWKINKMAGLIAKRDEQLSLDMLSFERLQHRTKGIDGKPLRGPLPCDTAQGSAAPIGNFARNILELLNISPRTAKQLSEDLHCDLRASSSMLSAMTGKSLTTKVGEKPSDGYAITQVGKEALAA